MKQKRIVIGMIVTFVGAMIWSTVEILTGWHVALVGMTIAFVLGRLLRDAIAAAVCAECALLWGTYHTILWNVYRQGEFFLQESPWQQFLGHIHMYNIPLWQPQVAQVTLSFLIETLSQWPSIVLQIIVVLSAVLASKTQPRPKSTA